MADILADLRELANDLDGSMPSVAVFVRMGAAEIERLRKVEVIAKAFLSEWDNPSPDYAYRVSLKQRLREATTGRP